MLQIGAEICKMAYVLAKPLANDEAKFGFKRYCFQIQNRLSIFDCYYSNKGNKEKLELGLEGIKVWNIKNESYS